MRNEELRLKSFGFLLIYGGVNVHVNTNKSRKGFAPPFLIQRTGSLK